MPESHFKDGPASLMGDCYVKRSETRKTQDWEKKIAGRQYVKN